MTYRGKYKFAVGCDCSWHNYAVKISVLLFHWILPLPKQRWINAFYFPSRRGGRRVSMEALFISKACVRLTTYILQHEPDPSEDKRHVVVGCIMLSADAHLWRLIGLLCSRVGREEVWRGVVDAEERIRRGRSAVRCRRWHNGTTETCSRQKSQAPGSRSLVPFSTLSSARLRLNEPTANYFII